VAIAAFCLAGQISAAPVSFVAAASAPQQGTVIDRILAIVSGGLILQSDVEAALRLGLITPPAGGDRIQVALDRLIERRLMLLEVERSAPPEPSGAQIDAALAEIDKRIASGDRLDAILRASGFTLDQLRLWVRDDLRLRAYLQQRFGASLTAADDEILEYYRSHAREFTREGALRPFTEVRDEARAALLAERRAGLIREWLASLRRRAEVNVLYLPGR
jgi:parvulin-like peptidyl-prolyl isomerase